MRDYLTIGAVPIDEDCAQVGTATYQQDANAECKRFVQLLRDTFPWLEDEDTYFKVKGFAHDFGNYYEVVVCYDSSDETSANKAVFVENCTPQKWGDETVYTEADFEAWKQQEIE
jgi:hypothetical protein